MFAFRRAVLLALVSALLFALPARADDAVKSAQTLLNELGYKVGKPDGAAGKKTLAAIAKAMEKYGQTFDGTVSDNEVAFLAAIAPARVKLDFDVAVSELFYLDSADINGDGRLDFAISAMADPAAQLGIPCCEVPANRVKDIVGPVPMLIYSTPEGFAVQPFPPEAQGNKSQSGRFFTTRTGHYFVLAKNGEMGLPVDNHGEVSLVFRITPGANVDIAQVATYRGRGVSANVDVVDIDGNGQPEIYLNNYGPIGIAAQVESSTIRQFAEDETLKLTKYTAALETDKAHNYVTLRDMDGDGKLDILAAAEIWKSLDGKEMVSKQPGSYVILDPFSRKTTAADRIYLLPPHYGNDHAGFSLMPITVDGRIFVFEVAMRFQGHQGGGFQYDNLDVFEFSPADKAFTQVTKSVLPKVAPTREKAGGYYLQSTDLDFDGVNEIYRQKYSSRPQYMDWNGKIFALKDFPAKDYFRPDWLGTLFYLPDPELKCTRMVTFPEYVGDGKHRTELQITGCLPASELN